MGMQFKKRGVLISFLTSIFLIAAGINAHGLDLENNRQFYSLEIGGWGSLHFGMPLRKARAYLKEVCEDVSVDKYSIKGVNCGKIYGLPYDISLFKPSDFVWWFTDKLIKFEIQFIGNKNHLDKLLRVAKTRWPNHSHLRCYEDGMLKGKCGVHFGSFRRLNIFLHSKTSKIELDYIDLNSFK